jgi:hypothetical protein
MRCHEDTLAPVEAIVKLLLTGWDAKSLYRAHESETGNKRQPPH